MDEYWMRIALVLGLVLVNAALAGSEMALVSLRGSQIRRLEHTSAAVGCWRGWRWSRTVWPPVHHGTHRGCGSYPAVTGCRTTALKRYPWVLNVAWSGWAAPVTSVARASSVYGPGAAGSHGSCHRCQA